MIYLDNAATTAVSNEAIEKINFMCTTNFGNPSSLHSLGINSEKEIINAKTIISKIINCTDLEIYFTSGATESNNLAIQGFLKRNKNGNHIISTKSEHPSVLENFLEFEKKGYTVSFLTVDETGNINLDELTNLINHDTSIVSIMHVNNETGVIMPIEKIGKIIKEKNPNTIFHVDGVQSFCKIPIDVKKSNIDLFSFSGHKIFSPKGVGGLYINKKVHIQPFFYGGEQMNKIRCGTENIIGIAALSTNASLLFKNMPENYDYVLDLKNLFLTQIKGIDDIFINGKNTSPFILNLSFENIRGEVLLHALEEENIFVSTGSACSSKSKNAMLYSYGFSDERVAGAVRFSFSIYNTKEEIIEACNIIKEKIAFLRKFVKR